MAGRSAARGALLHALYAIAAGNGKTGINRSGGREELIADQSAFWGVFGQGCGRNKGQSISSCSGGVDAHECGSPPIAGAGGDDSFNLSLRIGRPAFGR
ncbi:MAG TPA: hypothetical protein VG273_01360 [Bryobacteraceae bacterium]|nr:hypothetical protein [Bryobacteraceae bacterium]